MKYNLLGVIIGIIAIVAIATGGQSYYSSKDSPEMTPSPEASIKPAPQEISGNPSTPQPTMTITTKVAPALAPRTQNSAAPTPHNTPSKSSTESQSKASVVAPWKTYTASRFSFRYPGNYEVKDNLIDYPAGGNKVDGMVAIGNNLGEYLYNACSNARYLVTTGSYQKAGLVFDDFKQTLGIGNDSVVLRTISGKQAYYATHIRTGSTVGAPDVKNIITRIDDGDIFVGLDTCNDDHYPNNTPVNEDEYVKILETFVLN